MINPRTLPARRWKLWGLLAAGAIAALAALFAVQPWAAQSASLVDTTSPPSGNVSLLAAPQSAPDRDVASANLAIGEQRFIPASVRAVVVDGDRYVVGTMDSGEMCSVLISKQGGGFGVCDGQFSDAGGRRALLAVSGGLALGGGQRLWGVVPDGIMSVKVDGVGTATVLRNVFHLDLPQDRAVTELDFNTDQGVQRFTPRTPLGGPNPRFAAQAAG